MPSHHRVQIRADAGRPGGMMVLLACLSAAGCAIPLQPPAPAEIVVEEAGTQSGSTETRTVGAVSHELEETETVVEEAGTQSETTEARTTGAVSHGLEEEEGIIIAEDRWSAAEEAGQSADRSRPQLLIEAANLLIGQGQVQSAQSIVDELDRYALTDREKFDLHVLRARIAGGRGDHVRVIELLDASTLDRAPDAGSKADMLKTLGESRLALGRQSDGAAALLELDALLTGGDRLENQNRLIGILQSLDPLQLALLKENSPNPDVSGWLALVEILAGENTSEFEIDVRNWRAVYPQHPALPGLLDRMPASGGTADYRQIALLLPLTSRYGKAAQAFYDGFTDARNRDHGGKEADEKPELVLYDIGDDAKLAAFYHRAAENDGADFIVGPLGKQAVESLLAGGQPATETLLIADIPAGETADNLYSISLSPENEARLAAEKAYSSGLRKALVFRGEDDWGERVADTFTARWESLGGTVVKNSFFPADIPDYSRVIQKLLGLDKSIARHRLIEVQTGLNLEFSPRRNEDMDFIFLAADAAQARLVVPQLRFFQAHDLPIYATSYVYSGSPDPATDADLDGLIFGEMRWLVDTVTMHREAEAMRARMEAQKNEEQEQPNEGSLGDEDETEELPAAPENSGDPEGAEIPGPVSGPADEALVHESMFWPRPYKNTDLDRLYALGVQSHQIIPHLKRLLANDWSRFSGEAMTVSIDPDGNVVHHPVWVTFVDGLIAPLAPAE